MIYRCEAEETRLKNLVSPPNLCSHTNLKVCSWKVQEEPDFSDKILT